MNTIERMWKTFRHFYFDKPAQDKGYLYASKETTVGGYTGLSHEEFMKEIAAEEKLQKEKPLVYFWYVAVPNFFEFTPYRIGRIPSNIKTFLYQYYVARHDIVKIPQVKRGEWEAAGERMKYAMTNIFSKFIEDEYMTVTKNMDVADKIDAFIEAINETKEELRNLKKSRKKIDKSHAEFLVKNIKQMEDFLTAYTAVQVVIPALKQNIDILYKEAWAVDRKKAIKELTKQEKKLAQVEKNAYNLITKYMEYYF